ncbi:MAG: FAD-binding protein [Myxococcales bacterium]|nr:FAD-binding protein [Myxococcales bacterium]
MAPPRFVNWARNHRVRVLARHEPEGEDAVAALVRDVAARGERLRVVGAGHSWSGAAVPDQHLVSLDRHAGVVAIDPDARRVTVRAGTRLRDLVPVLDAAGLALENLGSIAEQSVAGAIATGTHGTGLGHGVLATQVVGMRLVTADGGVRVLDEAGGDDLLDAARVSLGALGVVTEVTLRVREAFDLEETSWSLPLEDAARELPDIARAHEHVKLWWLPHTKRAQVYAFAPTSAPRGGRSRLAERLDAALNRTAFPAILGLGRVAPRAVPALNRLVAASYFKAGSRVDRSDRVFNVAMPPRHLEMEYGLPVDAAGDALLAMRDLIERGRLKVGFVQEVRFVAADACHLSPASGRESCQLGAYVGRCRDADAFFRAFEHMALDRDGRPHWGKLFSADAATLAPRYPRWERFQALRRELDPAGVFSSAFTRRVFGPG